MILLQQSEPEEVLVLLSGNNLTIKSCLIMGRWVHCLDNECFPAGSRASAGVHWRRTQTPRLDSRHWGLEDLGSSLSQHKSGLINSGVICVGCLYLRSSPHHGHAPWSEKCGSVAGAEWAAQCSPLVTRLCCNTSVVTDVSLLTSRDVN